MIRPKKKNIEKPPWNLIKILLNPIKSYWIPAKSHSHAASPFLGYFNFPSHARPARVLPCDLWWSGRPQWWDLEMRSMMWMFLKYSNVVTVYRYIYIYICMIYVYVYVYDTLHKIWLYMYGYVYDCMYIYIYIYMCIYTHSHVYVYVCICIYIYTHVDVTNNIR